MKRRVECMEKECQGNDLFTWLRLTDVRFFFFFSKIQFYLPGVLSFCLKQWCMCGLFLFWRSIKVLWCSYCQRKTKYECVWNVPNKFDAHLNTSVSSTHTDWIDTKVKVEHIGHQPVVGRICVNLEIDSYVHTPHLPPVWYHGDGNNTCMPLPKG
jgi:hypothetical protein